MYNIRHRAGKCNGNADMLSRLPLNDGGQSPTSPEQVAFVKQLETGPLSVKQVADLTAANTELSKLRTTILERWPTQPQDPTLELFWTHRAEISVEEGLAVWGRRVVIPRKARRAVLLELHDAHSGMAAMKSLARSLCWWPNMDRDIENMARNCHQCQQAQPMPPSRESLSRPAATIPWSRIILTMRDQSTDKCCSL